METSDFISHLKKREQNYLIENEQARLLAYPQNTVLSTGGCNNAKAFAALLKKYPNIDYSNKSTRKIINHIYSQLCNLDVPFHDEKLQKMVANYLDILEANARVNCSRYNYVPVGVLPQPRRLVVIGDLHADYCVTLECLALAGIIPSTTKRQTEISQIKCIARPDTIVVQLGDKIDGDGRGIKQWKQPECQSFIKIHKLFDHLNRTGRVTILSVYGNHELMNLDANFKYRPGKHLSPKEAWEIKQYGLAQLRQDLVCTHRPFWIVGDWLLVHGGVTDDWFEAFGGPLSSAQNPELSSEMAGRVLQNYYTNTGRANAMTKKIMSTLQDGHTHGPNPTWNRSYGHNGSCVKVPKSLRGVIKNIAVSHTVQDGYHITSSNCGGTRIFRMDTGMSGAFGNLGNPAALICEAGQTWVIEKLPTGQIRKRLFT